MRTSRWFNRNGSNRNQRHLMKTKILRKILLNVGVFLALTWVLIAGPNDGILDVGDTPLCHSHPTFITFDPPGGPAEDIVPSGINPMGTIIGTYLIGSF